MAGPFRWCIALVLAALAGVPALASVPPEAGELEWVAMVRSVDHHPRQAVDTAQVQLRSARERRDEAAELKALSLLSLVRAATGETIGHADDERRGLVLARKLGDRSAECWYLDSEAWLEFEEGRTDEANRRWDAVIALARAHGLQRRLAWTLASRGTSLHATGRKAEALTWLTQAYEIFASRDDRYGMASLLLNIGDTYAGSEATAADQARAGDHFKRALDLVDTQVYRRLAAEAHLRLGLSLARRGLGDTAREHYAASLAASRAIGFDQLEGNTRHHLATLEMSARRPAQALAHLDRAREILLVHPNRVQRVLVFSNRAQLLAEAGRRDEARAALQEARDALAEADTPANQAHFLPRAAAARFAFGEHAEAYRLAMAARAADKLLADAHNARLGDELRARFEVSRREAENALLRSQRSEAESRRWLTTIALGSVLLVLAGVAFVLRKRAQAARTLAEHHRRLAEAETAANRAKSTFLANMSHELRSPLNAMLGFARLLSRDTSLPARARDDLSIVLRSGEHLYALINQVLEMSKIEAGRTSLVEADADLHGLLDELREMFSVVARDKGLALHIRCGADVPRAWHGDAMKLRQVLINLLSNALKFTSRGEVSLSVECTATAAAPRLRFEVADTGEGIAEEELAGLGQAFQQAAAGQRAADGTGLGLAISRGFVDLMGGELRLSSVPGVQTRVEFTLPLKSAAAATQPLEKRRRVSGLAAGTAAPRILVVDDRADGRLLLVRTLAPLGFEVREAADGAQAIAAWEQWSPHLVLMDMRMPVMDGMEAARRIKADPRGRDTVVVALTASSFEEQRDDIFAAGCDDFLRKPFREDALLDTLARHLKLEYAHEEAEAPVEQAPPDAPQLATLPQDLRDRLRRALEQLDVHAVDVAIADMRAQHAVVADALQPLASRFQYARIRALLDAA